MSDPAMEELRAAFGGRLLTRPDDMAPFLVDWRRHWFGAAQAVAMPDTTADVAAIVRWCAATRTPIVPQGGNTGLSGGATPDASGRSIVLSLRRLNRVRGVDTANDTLTVEAGCILQAAQQAAASSGRLLALSLAAEGSCTIGGNLATNAGGTAVLRYGTARAQCLGLEVVTAAGEIWDGLRGLRKDNSGLDLRDLFIGAEGTLGIITAAVMKLHPLPAGRCTALAAIASPADAVRLLQHAQARLGPALTAAELMSDRCLRLVQRHFPATPAPLATPSPWYLLLEATDPAEPQRPATDLQDMLAAAAQAGLATDATVAASPAQSRALWALRENISDAQGLGGAAVKHDISVPVSRIADFIGQADAAMAAAFPDLRVGAFGHVGDGNVHYNILPAEGDRGAGLAGRTAAINRAVHDIAVSLGGSISAEHGLGALRGADAARAKSPVELRLNRAIKTALDPAGLMNPGKMLP